MTQGESTNMSGGPTFEDPLTMQEVPGDNHCVEVLGEAWCAWRFDGLARLTRLGNEKKKGDALLNTSKSTVTTESQLSLALDELWLHSMAGSRPGSFQPRSYRELPCDTSPAGLITVMVPPSSLAPLLQMLDKLNNMTAQSCIEHFRNDDHSCRATCGEPTSGSRE